MNSVGKNVSGERMRGSDWTDTALWERLKSSGEGAEKTRHYVKTWLDDVQTLLAKAGTSPLIFTLHDDGHSYRVAQRMVDLVPDDTLERLSDPELALLLLSAYLHDIGMNPNYEIVLKVRAFLLSGISNLPPVEADRLQKWLDETNPGMQPPLLQGLSDDQRVENIELLTAHYCRFRHNDWSEEFISDKAQYVSNAPYGMFVQDLIALCKSHHFGMQELMSPSFDLRIVGTGNRLVNLRYLAAVLRVADVLEFDPERTPEVIFAHRAIPVSSKIFWYKDHSIVLGISKKNSSVLITARTSDAWTHRAVLDTANDVDAEFQTCANIRDQNGFSRGVKLDSADYYIWPWPPRSAHDISPIPGTFEYIDGAFRPDNRRILGLLAGTQLYESALAAIRELLQNAFDSVKEQIALELLNDPNAHKREVQEARSKLHRVTLLLETHIEPKTKKEETWLVCTDTGVGMTRRIIERHLLVGGSKPRPELLRLERLCNAEGINLNRSGEFGIGVLSYFMLADKLVLETRSSPEAYSDHEPHGWRFETEGLDAFGELRAVHGSSRGCTVRLRISERSLSLLSAPQIENYLRSMLAQIPCELMVQVGSWSNRWNSDWAKSVDEFKDRTLSRREELELIGRNRLKTISEKRHDEIEEEVVEHGLSRLRFVGPYKGLLPDKMGCYRIHLPYFELDDGASLIFVALNSGIWKQFWALSDVLALSWRGFRVSNESDDEDMDTALSIAMAVPCIVEIDLWKGAKVDVNRRRLKIENRKPIKEFIEQEISKVLCKFAESNRINARYCSLISAWANLTLPTKVNNFRAFWMFREGAKDDGRYVWREARFPALQGTNVSRQNPVVPGDRDLVRPIHVYERSYALRVAIPFTGLAPSKLIVAGNDISSCDFYLLYENGENLTLDDAAVVEFPPEWKEVLAIATRELPTILNQNHPTVNIVTPSFRAAFLEKFRGIGNERILADGQLQTSEDCAAWLLSNISHGRHEWQVLIENFQPCLLAAFDKAKCFLTYDCVRVLNFEPYNSFMIQITSTQIELHSLDRELKSEACIEFPKDPKWLL